MKADDPALEIIPSGVPWGQVGLFAGLTIAFAWALSLPFYAGWLPYSGTPLLIILITLMFAMIAPFVGALFGWYPLDLTELSGFRETITTALEAQGGDAESLFAIMGVWGFLGLTLFNMLIGGLINSVAAFGEELGWRGWLLPKLMPLGAWPAMLLSGALWGLWHAPIILLGHNYPSAPVPGVFLFIGFCMLWGVLHGWTRIATGSVWPAALMHGSLNASAGSVIFFHTAGYEPDNVWVGLIGVSGWIVPILVVLALALVGWLPGRRVPDREGLTAPPLR